MSSEDPSPEKQSASAVSPNRVTLSKWVNEPFPPWEQLLTAHDVVRLTRRPRWLLHGMTLIGRFPRRLCFHGRGIGWLRNDVLEWMAEDLQVAGCHAQAVRVCAARRNRSGCSARKAP